MITRFLVAVWLRAARGADFSLGCADALALCAGDPGARRLSSTLCMAVRAQCFVARDISTHTDTLVRNAS